MWILGSFVCLVFSFIPQSSQVDIVLRSTYPYTNAWNEPSTGILEQQCPSHPPGVCCLSIDPNAYLPFHGAEFQHLLVEDVAITWMARSEPTDNGRDDPIAGCNGIIADTHQGPGSWRFQFSTWLDQALADGDARARRYGNVAYGRASHRGMDTGVVGASYISIPLKPKTDPDDKEHFMLEAQGIRGLAWGGGKWFADGFSMRSLPRVLPGKLDRRYIRWPDKGTVYVRPPVKGVYPSIVAVNGTSYAGDGRDNLTYKDVNGTVLDLRTLGVKLAHQHKAK